MTKSQKDVVMLMHNRNMGAPSRVQSEFKRIAITNAANNINIIPEPSVAKISSFLSYGRKKQRGGVPVGRTTLQDLANIAATRQPGEYDHGV